MELAERSPDELEEAIGQLHGLMTVAHRELLRLVAAFDASEAWRADEVASMVEWLTMRLGVSVQTARTWLRAAHALEELPETAKVFGQGCLSWDQLRHLVRFVTPETDQQWSREAPELSAARLEHVARARRPVTREDDEKVLHARRLRFRADPKLDAVRLSGVLPEADAATVRKALDLVVDQSPPDPVTNTYEPAEKRRADALVELAGVRLNQEPDPDRATVVVHMDVGLLTEGQGTAVTEQGGYLSQTTAQRLACDSRWLAVTDDAHGRPLGVGRTTRRISPWMMRQLRYRDKCCRFPGCRRVVRCAAHHLLHWAQLGPTDLDNLLLLCPYHHRLVHEGGWKISGDPNDKLVFIRPDGHPHIPGPPPLGEQIRTRFLGPPPGAPPDPPPSQGPPPDG